MLSGFKIEQKDSETSHSHDSKILCTERPATGGASLQRSTVCEGSTVFRRLALRIFVGAHVANDCARSTGADKVERGM